ncbi:xanthine dehydrogenase subunit D [Salisediminibacterium halotolerans]|uniref:Xanthine dehydrogenase D subunit n=1 Tax=Salisediminibacterium halotolerans TaxID=517425 RepID=A0A1H9T8C6_9BACI|nr:xanthine dehydrogenase subunit D [Salisediminibacterium haloalkalitolerans]SER93029.1 xanthine dehydrogenase D subunit [Salisediminibacterium haloalkalitolerans]
MNLNKYQHREPWKLRPDGEAKVTGKMKYLTDLHADGELYGRVLRSGVPHAALKQIDVTEAQKLPGVKAVLTAEDVPGLNGFGIADPNQPVFCESLIRFEGDALAAVAADTPEIAAEALTKITVDYDVLPVLDTPEKALEEQAPQLHEEGNLLHRRDYERGDTAAAFEAAAYVVEETYETPRQMHVFMETEGGLFVPGESPALTVYAATQHGYKDQMQLARILSVPEEEIRVISSPIGGSFGGKDELNVQPFGALLACHTEMPVRMHYSRHESVIAGIKRHPMKVTMKTGIDAQGQLLAHETVILSDTGAYATLGAPVLNFAVEHAVGAYEIASVKINGKAVYTNNGISGEFRGFGGNQVIFALEGQLDRLAEKSGIDAWELRRRNLRSLNSPGPLGQVTAPNDGPELVWNAIQTSPLFGENSSLHHEDDPPWVMRGRGYALAMHGSGLGYGIPDPAGGTICLNQAGQIETAFGHEEFGQGLLGTLQIMLMNHFGCTSEDINIVIGDTENVPPSGSSTASRTTNMVWKALENMKAPFLEQLFAETAKLTGYEKDQLKTGEGGIYYQASGEGPAVLALTYRELAERKAAALQSSTSFHYPVTPDPVLGAHYIYGSVAVATEVTVDTLTGAVKVERADYAVSAGEVMNPGGYLGQIEGGSVMALGFTLSEDAVMDKGEYLTRNLDSYLVPTIHDAPKYQEVEAIETLPEGDEYGPRGVGEIGSVVLAPAIVKAVHDAVGEWFTVLPLQAEKIVDAAETTRDDLFFAAGDRKEAAQ